MCDKNINPLVDYVDGQDDQQPPADNRDLAKAGMEYAINETFKALGLKV